MCWVPIGAEVPSSAASTMRGRLSNKWR
jgi:hypothetical protein